MGIKNGFFEIYNRETGVYGSRCFVRRYSSNEGVLNRLDLYRELNGHINYVKTLEFNSSGDLLVSSSLDRQVIFWNWETNTRRLSYDSGHSRKVFQAKIMPSTADKKIVTSAGDGQLRLGEVSEDGRVDTKCLEMRRGCIYGVAVEPEHPHILYSCGDNAFIHHFDLRTCTPTKLFRCIKFKKIDPLLGVPYGLSLHAMVFDPMNPNYFCVGGSDPYARLYDVRKLRLDASSNLDKPVNIFAPHHLNTSSDIHITGLAYSNSSELLVTYADELIYLFQKNMGLGHSPSSADMLKLDKPQAFMGHRNCLALKGVNFLGPNDDYILSGSDDGHIFIWKKNGAKLVRVIKGNCPVHQIAPHPHIQIIATCGVENSVKVWAPMENDTPPLPCNIEEIMESNREARAVQLQRLMLIRSRGRIVYPEINYLGRLRHPNLVKLIGYCPQDDERLLVYEFMPCGSLDNHLFRRGSYSQPLSWTVHMKIALGAAKVVAFFHSDEAKVIHRNFKSSNILLDSNYNAKVSSLDLAKDGPAGDRSHVSTRVMGTNGYASPECIATGHLTAKCDVYGFGVVMLEMLSGKRFCDKNRPTGEHNLVEWAKPYHVSRHRVVQIIDARVEGQYSVASALKAADLAFLCSSADPKLRPNMNDVVKTLEQLQESGEMENPRPSKNDPRQNPRAISSNGPKHRRRSIN